MLSMPEKKVNNDGICPINASHSMLDNVDSILSVEVIVVMLSAYVGADEYFSHPCRSEE